MSKVEALRTAMDSRVADKARAPELPKSALRKAVDSKAKVDKTRSSVSEPEPVSAADKSTVEKSATPSASRPAPDVTVGGRPSTAVSKPDPRPTAGITSTAVSDKLSVADRIA